MNRKLSAISAFYEFHQRHGVDLGDLLTTWQRRGSGGGSWRPLLAHLGSRPERARRISLREQRRIPDVLDGEQITAIVAACDRLRDKFLLVLLAQSGLRVSELVGLNCSDLGLGNGAHVRCEGKGRKERCTPLRQETAEVMGNWLRECPDDPATAVFPSSRGGPLSRDAVERLVSRHQRAAERHCQSLARKKVTPHVLRHTTALHLLRAGVDIAVIALWLGHESIETTHISPEIDLAHKEQALHKLAPVEGPMARFTAPDPLLAFLSSL